MGGGHAASGPGRREPGGGRRGPWGRAELAMTTEFLLPEPQTSRESAAQCGAGNPRGRARLRPGTLALAPWPGLLKRSWGPQQAGCSTEAGLEPCVDLDKEVGAWAGVRGRWRARDLRIVLAGFRAEILPE